ncbi:5-hydroxytryptamine receptor 3B [Myotis davidii]|uniref:5-hydroxytryptamine receptor 3B n=1 Tax=Myotis davidii TaxID=225400 RepID=L5M0S4_MYODS|nr:5-hydroxytryptamine receptor 3B [Myotis davidii]
MAPLWPFILVAASGILAIDTPHPRNSALYHLTKQLLQRYQKDVRPVHDWTEATTVYLDVFVRAVLDVAHRRCARQLSAQLLAERCSRCGSALTTRGSSCVEHLPPDGLNDESSHTPPEDVREEILNTGITYRMAKQWKVENHWFKIWIWLIMLEVTHGVCLYRNSSELIYEVSLLNPSLLGVDIERLPELHYVYVNSSGTVRNSKSIQVVSACSLETYAFPFDIQNCSLTFNSILHTVEDVDLAFLRSREDVKHDRKAFSNDSEWELLSVSSAYSVLQSSAGDFAQIQFHVVIRRRPLVYVVSLLIPSIFLMLVDLGSFYIPPTCHARIIFKTSLLVGYTVFRVNMSDEMPQGAVRTPLIGVFFTVCMAFLVLSLSKSILLVKFLHDQQHSGQERPLLGLGGDTDADGLLMDRRTQLVGVTESPVCREHQAPSGTLKEVLSQLQSISNYFQAQDQAAQQEVGWLALLERVDRLLFQGYLVMLGLYAITLCSLWALWSRL